MELQQLNELNNSNDLCISDIVTTPKEKPIPKGCKRYYFNKNGICCKSESEVYFDALKPSYANKRFKRWLLNFNDAI